MQRPLTRAIILAPISVLPAGILGRFVIATFDIGGENTFSLSDIFQSTVEFSLFAILPAYAAVLLVGWPIHSMAVRLKHESPLLFLVPGLLCGVLIGFASAPYYRMQWMTVSILTSLFVATTFWWIRRIDSEA